MSVQQISVFLENRAGSLEEITSILGNGGIDLIALSIADTTDFGILRAIVNDEKKALKLAKEHGYTANLTNVLAVATKDSPGGLCAALTALHKAGIFVEYLYALVRRVKGKAIIIFRVDELEKAQDVLTKAGFALLSQSEITVE